MNYRIQADDNRLSISLIVSSAELMASSQQDIVRHATRSMAERLVDKLMRNVVASEAGVHRTDVLLTLNMYAFTRTELESLIADARESGRQDAMRWMRPTLERIND